MIQRLFPKLGVCPSNRKIGKFGGRKTIAELPIVDPGASCEVDFVQIPAAGLTEMELHDKLVERLKQYMYNPRVIVFVKEYRSQQVERSSTSCERAKTCGACGS
jgi:hypothetical protein